MFLDLYVDKYLLCRERKKEKWYFQRNRDNSTTRDPLQLVYYKPSSIELAGWW